MSESCQIEPLARVDLAEELEDQVRRSLHAGASLELEVEEVRPTWSPRSYLE